MKKYIVTGLGNFGLTLARNLEENKCEVISVDISRDRVESIKDLVSHCIIGDATSKGFLSSLDLEDFDGAVICIGKDMSSSTLIALYLKEIGVKNIIVRAVSEDHGTILKKIGVSEVLYPETEAAVKLANRLSMKNALDFIPLTENHGILEVIPPRNFIGKSLKELQISSRFHSQVIAIKYPDSVKKQGNGVLIKIPPTADDIITENTIMIIIGKLSDIEKIQSLQ